LYCFPVTIRKNRTILERMFGEYNTSLLLQDNALLVNGDYTVFVDMGLMMNIVHG